MLASIYQAVTNQRGGTAAAASGIDVVSALLALVIYFVLITLIGQYIWNNVLAKYVTIVKPVNNWYEFWLLVMLFHLMIPSSIHIVGR